MQNKNYPIIIVDGIKTNPVKSPNLSIIWPDIKEKITFVKNHTVYNI